MLDMHDVLDRLTFSEADTLGVALKATGIPFGILSYGKGHSYKVWTNKVTCNFVTRHANFVAFTDEREPVSGGVCIYRPPNWANDKDFNCIRINGSKGQFAALLNRPCILFDDKEVNIS